MSVMLGDVLLIQETHKKAAAVIKEYMEKDLESKPKGYKYIVAISGESGAGKSELSHSLAKLLKEDDIRVKVLHTDNYIKLHFNNFKNTFIYNPYYHGHA